MQVEWWESTSDQQEGFCFVLPAYRISQQISLGWVLEAQAAALVSPCRRCTHLLRAHKYSLCKKGSSLHPTALAELKCHEPRPCSRLVRDDSRWIPTLGVYLHLEAVLPTHLQGSNFPKEIFQGLQFALVCSVSPQVRTGALPSTQAAAESLAIQHHRVINYLDYLCSSLRCSLPQILAVYRQDSVIPTQLSIFGCQTSL